MPIAEADIQKATILIVDDQPANVKLLEKMLRSAGYVSIISTCDSLAVEQIYLEQDIDLVLLDIRMPRMDGFEVMGRLKALAEDEMLSILVLTAQTDQETRLRSLSEGAKDFLTKPFDRLEVLNRIRNMLEVRLLHKQVSEHNEQLAKRVKERTEEIEQTRLEVIQRLGRAAEYRDNETGMHVLRMSHYSYLIGLAAGMDPSEAEMLLHAAPMHDIGKIGIPDSILLKPGKLDEEEWLNMQRHAEIGADILSGSNSPLLDMARVIALTHHEKWDGSGYPYGLKEDNIPLVGRIVPIADVFDALTSKRPYKEAWSVEDAIDEIVRLKGRHFDPVLVEHFIAILPQILNIKERFAEPD